MIAAKTSLSRAALLGGAATFVLALAAPTAAWAQAAQTAAADDAAAEDSEIVVTGSLIKNPNLIASTPVNVTTAETIQLQASNVAEEVLRNIPGIVPSVGSAVNNGNGGASFVDLRGLGPNRNIVLLDSQRIAPSGLAGQVDLNNIPLALIQRVDTSTGAAVTTYGADAITGVVNFITKKDFSGVDLQLSNGITEKGDGNNMRVDLTVGGNFADGRGNAVLSIGYQRVEPVSQGNRDISNPGINSSTGLPGGSPTKTPARLFAIRPIDPVTGLPSIDPNVPNLGNSEVAADGSRAVPFGQLFDFNPFNIFQTPFRRFNIFAKAEYQVSDSLQFYTRGLFSKNVVETILAPSGLFAQTVTLPLSNPFLNSTIRGQYCAFNTTPSPDPVTGVRTYTPRFTPAECDAAALATNPTDPNYRQIRVPISRRTVETGTRDSEFTTTIFDYHAGLRGKLTSTVDWDVSASYGESVNSSRQPGSVIISRVTDAILATNPNECLSGDTRVPTCVPLNVFGPTGSITPEMLSYITGETGSRTVTSLAQVRAVATGDFGIAIPSAADAIGFAVGAEYRDYYAAVQPDSFSELGDVSGSGGPTPRVEGSYNVTEVYGEIVAPIVQDKPFFQNLTVEVGARYSSYNIRAPGNPSFDTFTWKAGGSWEFATGYKLRGNYSRAVRAPNIGELFSPVSRGLTNLLVDPCAGSREATSPSFNPLLNDANLRAVCIAQGAAPSQVGFIEQPAAGQANAYGGGNINLRPETATTWTLGAVLQPQFAPGLAVTVDYYNIVINRAVSSPTPGDAIDACFGNITAGSANSPACLAIFRNPDTGSFDGNTNGIPQNLSNLGIAKTDGIDVTVSYARDIGFAKLGVSGNFNYTFNSEFQASPSAIFRECVGFFSDNCNHAGGSAPSGSILPKWQSSLRTTLGFDWVDISLLWRHIDSVRREPLASPLFPAFQRISAYDYFDLSTRFNVTERISLIATVANLTDAAPPLVGSAAGATTFNSGNTFPSTYDALGRRYTMQLNVRF